MKLTVVGSADAFNACGRGNACYLLESPGAGTLMVDFGPTALAGLRRLGIDPNAIDALLFTHLHGDHTGGFPLFAIDALYASRRSRPLSIVGPILTREVLRSLMLATYAEVLEDLERLNPSFDEVLPGEQRELCGYRLATFAADHMKPPHRPLCLRLSDPQGRSIAFSGDTRLCDGLFAAADAADLLVAECTRLAPPAGHHATWQEWQAELPRLRARSLLLTHLGADVRERVPVLLAGAQSPLPVAFADDGLCLEL